MDWPGEGGLYYLLTGAARGLSVEVLRQIPGDILRSGDAVMTITPVLAAGVGAGHGWRSGRLRSASFRIDAPLYGVVPLGIAISRQSVATTLVDLLAGLTRPAYGELRVLGEDLTTARGRAALRARVGVARRAARRGWPRRLCTSRICCSSTACWTTSTPAIRSRWPRPSATWPGT